MSNPRLGEYAKKAGTQFSSTYQPGNAGRKPNAIRAYIKENDLSAQDVRSAISNLVTLTDDQLMDVANDKKAPVLLRGFARALIKEIKDSGLANMETLITRAFGKPTEYIQQNIDLTATVATMTREEKIAELKRLSGAASAAKKPRA